MEDPRILAHIPTPPAQRWREVRLLYLPRTVFVVGVLVAAWLWSHAIAPATLVAEADTQQADLRSTHAGVISSLTVGVLERVRMGQIVGYVTPSDPRPATTITLPAIKAPEAAGKPAEPAPAAPLVPLMAPIDGVVSRVLRRPGETVDAGDSVIRIVSKHVERLTGYLRQPLPFEPEVGMTAEIRTRGPSRKVAMTTITSVGVAMESIPSSLAAAMHLPEKPVPEDALRLHFAMPGGLTLRPGEHVDIIIH